MKEELTTKACDVIKNDENSKSGFVWAFTFTVSVAINNEKAFLSSTLLAYIKDADDIEREMARRADKKKEEKRNKILGSLNHSIEIALKLLGTTDYFVEMQYSQVSALGARVEYKGHGVFAKEHNARKRCSTIQKQIKSSIDLEGQFLVSSRDLINEIQPIVVCIPSGNSRKQQKEYLDSLPLKEGIRYIQKREIEQVDPWAVLEGFENLDPHFNEKMVKSLPYEWRKKHKAHIIDAYNERARLIVETTIIKRKYSVIVCPSEALKQSPSGVGGVGKSKLAWEIVEMLGYKKTDVYKVTVDKNQWDNYNLQECVFIDDWGREVEAANYREFKLLTDPYPDDERGMIMGARFHHVGCIASRFIINTPLPLVEFAHKLDSNGGGVSQVYRRFIKMFEVDFSQVEDLMNVYEYTWKRGMAEPQRSANPVGYIRLYDDRRPTIEWVNPMFLQEARSIFSCELEEELNLLN